MTRATLEDRAVLKRHGLKVERWGNKGFTLSDPDGHTLMVGDYGQISPTEWEAIAEGIKRIGRGDY